MLSDAILCLMKLPSYAKILVSDLGNMVVGSTLYVSGGRGTYDIR